MNEKERFKALCLEVLPVAEKLLNILKAHGVERMANLVVDPDGYMDFETGDTQWRMVRIGKGSGVEIEYSYRETISAPEQD